MSRKLRTGFTTGTCAAAAAKAASMILAGALAPEKVEVRLPDGQTVKLPVAESGREGETAWASVRKDAGDDPDVTDGLIVKAAVSWMAGDDVSLKAGEGVGVVTKPGLSVPPGEPAINPVPQEMIREAVREVTRLGALVTVSIPNGEELAKKTFNPRLGVLGGLSILGTSGLVRPFSAPALRDALKCALSVANACAIDAPVLVPGRIGERAARRHFRLAPEQVVEVSNEWGFMLDEAAQYDFRSLLALGHPGKLAKLATGDWDTHSSRSRSAAPMVRQLAEELIGRSVDTAPTVEGLFTSLPPVESRRVGNELAGLVAGAVFERVGRRFPTPVVLVNMKGEVLGANGDLNPWRIESP
ncbi:MAG: cobalamin biosynthesis protein CbiD [Deltaproteobacteria bacterium]|nr:cobalamin biosynthesis protein CbiD [Deltaproteobacteria bacterium]